MVSHEYNGSTLGLVTVGNSRQSRHADSIRARREKHRAQAEEDAKSKAKNIIRTADVTYLQLSEVKSGWAREETRETKETWGTTQHTLRAAQPETNRVRASEKRSHYERKQKLQSTLGASAVV